MKKIFYLLAAILFVISPVRVSAQNNALDFDGVDDYVTTSNAINLSFKSFAIEGWFKADVLPSAVTYPHIFGVSDDAVGPNAAFVRINGDSKKLEFVMQSDAGYKVVTSPETIEAGKWYHAAILYHMGSPDDVQYLLINGEVVAYEVFTHLNNYSNYYFGIGGDGTRNFDGQVDDVKIWSGFHQSSQGVRVNMYKEVVGNESNLVAYYNLDETSGTTTDNAQGNTNYDGTLTNMTGNEWTTSPAFFGPKNCLNFDGDDDNVWCSSISPTVTSGSIEFWVNLDVIPTDNARLISRGATSSSGDEIYLIADDGRIATTGSLVVGDDLLSTSPLPTDVWTHVAITADGTGSKLYINGVLDDTGGAAGFGFDSFRFGGQYTGSFYEGIDGMMDEVRLWNVVRTESEIRENMFKSLAGDESNLVAYYNLDNLYGAVAQSYPAEANDGSIGGGATWFTSTAFNSWLNTDNSDWATASNWSNGVPSSTDNIGIKNGTANPSISGATTVNNLVIETGAELTVASNTLTNSGKLYNYGTLTGTGTIINNDEIDGPGNIVINGTLTNNGTVTTNNLTNNTGGNVNVSASNLITVDGDVTNNGTFSVTGTLSNSGASSTFTNSGTLTSDGDITLYDLLNNSSFNVNVNASKLLTVNNEVWNDGTITSTGTFVNNGASSLFLNYGGLVSDGDIQLNDLTNYTGVSINAGKVMTIDGTLSNESSFIIESPSSLGATGSLITNGTLNNSGTMIMYRWISEGSLAGTDYNWHMVSPPNGGASAGTFFDNSDYVYSYDETFDQWINLPEITDMISTGRGYIVKTIGADKTLYLPGTFNSGHVEVFVENSASGNGYNLVGNPYPSPIDLELMDFSDFNTTIYHWYAGNDNWAYYDVETNLYANGGSQYIHPAQGFFVQVTDEGSTTLVFEDIYRTHNTGGDYFKKSAEESNQGIRFKVSDEKYYDEMVLNYLDLENESYKIFSMNPFVPQLFLMDDFDENFVFYNVSGELVGKELKLGFRSDAEKTFSMAITELDFDSYDIMLRDELTASEILLEEGSTLNFSHSPDAEDHRFTLIFSTKSTIGIKDDTDKWNWVYSDNRNINVMTPGILNADISVMNLNGQLITQFKANSDRSIIPIPTEGLYIVKIVSNNQVSLKKIIVK